MSNEVLSLEYFPAGVPAGAFFKFTLDDLIEVCDSCEESKGAVNRKLELVLIGLLSYFEAFCKDHFSSIINIEPSLLESLKKNGQNTSVDASSIPLYKNNILNKIGSIVSEQYDFGTAKKINALYSSLLNITPFSKKDIRRYEELLNDRNLLVHHGGVYTLRYLQQKGYSVKDIKDNAYWNSIVFTKEDVFVNIDFISRISEKIVTASHKALIVYMQENNINILGARKEAVNNHLGQWCI